VFQKAPAAGQSNLPPSAGMQFFGQIDIDHRSGHDLSLKDLSGAALFSQWLWPRAARGR
jgi:alkaline phosphatase D